MQNNSQGGEDVLLDEWTKRVAFYLRVSTEEQADKYGFLLQRDKMERLLSTKEDYRELAWEEYVYQEDISGTTEISARVELSRLFDDLQFAKDNWLPQPFHLVMVYRIDRFARKLRILLDIVEKFKEYNVGFVSCLESVDTSTYFWRAMLGILGVFAELEREMNTEKMGAWRVKFLEEWKRLQDIYGYKRDESNFFKIYAREASVVRKIFELYVYNSYSISQITRHLESEKILIPSASKLIKREWSRQWQPYKDPYKWGDRTVRSILNREEYIWISYFGKTKSQLDTKSWKVRKTIKIKKEDWSKVEGRIPPIIDEELFTAAQERYKNGKQAYKKADEWKYLLTKLLYCDACKHLARRKWMLQWRGDSANKVQSYMCQWKGSKYGSQHQCHCVPLPKEALEQEVVMRLKEFMKNPSILAEHYEMKKIGQKKIEQWQEIIDECQNQLTQIELGKNNTLQLCESGLITKTSYYQQLEVLSKREQELWQKLRKCKSRLKEAADTSAYIKSFEYLIKTQRDNMEKIFKDRQILAMFMWLIIDRIIIYSNPRPLGVKMPGRNKGEQWIPYKITLQLRLPQDIVKAMYENTKLTGDLVEDWRRFSWSDGRFITKWINQEMEALLQRYDPNSKTQKKLQKLQEKMQQWETLSEDARIKNMEHRIKNNPKEYKFLLEEIEKMNRWDI